MFIPVGVLAQRTVLGTQTVCGDNSASGGVVLVLLFVESVQELCVVAVTNCGSVSIFPLFHALAGCGRRCATLS